MKKAYYPAILAIIVLAIGAIIFWKRPAPAPSPTPSVNVNQPVPSVHAPIRFTGQAAIEIPATVPAGDSLTFDKVMMPAKGFVVVKDKSGKKIIGASNLLIFPETRDFKTAIAVKAGQSYIAELHGDDGDGLFDPKTDPPFIINDKTITASFKVR
jgi:hypothetical protein